MEGGGSRNDEDPTQSNRSSYYDIIQEHESGTAYRDLISSKSGNNKSRKSFNDRLRLSRSSSTRLSPSRPVPASDVTFGSHRFQPSSAYPGDDYVVDCDGDVCVTRSRLQSSSRRQSGRVVVEDPEDDAPNRSGSGGRFSRSTSVAVTRELEEDEEEDEEEEEEEEAKEEEAQVAPAKVMSLMDLLEETDRQAGVVGATYYSYEEEEEEEEEEVEEGEGVVEHVCCVCMVRHKGAAFIPCGHTFCRLCSRELWVSRGNCPLCNGYIMEILDIF